MTAIHVIAIGRWKSCPEKELWDEYAKRLSWKLTLKECEVKKPSQNTEKRKEEEAAVLLEAAPKGAYKVALDEHGKLYSSQAFAMMLNHAAESARPVAFFIGGADGHGQALLKAADSKLSLGAMTWPHMLVRAMLAEQVYRGWSILANHPYHRV